MGTLIKNSNPAYVGIDIGSTTVKAVVLDASDTLVWKRYQRHNAKQPELVLGFLKAIESAFPGRPLQVFCTGNGGRTVAPHIRGVHIQEVNAVTYAVERMHPNAGSVVELGGQDSKVIIWKTDSTGRKSSISYMNDKCASGTGATIDKIFSKIDIDPVAAAGIRFRDQTVHHVAAKCGVFAETDVVGLLKAGVDKEEIVISLCTAIVKQNLEVLLHGNVLKDDVLLLGGPHTFLPVMADIWRKAIPETWDIHGFKPTTLSSTDKQIYVPLDAEYFAAIGAVLFGRENADLVSTRYGSPSNGQNAYTGTAALMDYIGEGRLRQLESSGALRKGLVNSEEEVAQFAAQYAVPPFEPPPIPTGTTVPCYLGIDGGSTSSKLAIIDERGEVLYKDYVLSKGNPIIDIRQMFERLSVWKIERDIHLDIRGTGVTGYASKILSEAFNLDVLVVETIAHMKSAQFYYGDVDVICDVGGQDIKVLFMKHGRVVDLNLNTQCSAGCGYFIQNMAQQFGIPVEEFAEHAFRVRKAPSFNYGCAVFMEQDKVNFQQLGWTKDEIMAGLALVLPINIWTYVVQETNLSRLGNDFLLQGGTQKNLAAVKAQVDYIRAKVPGARVRCHKYADLCGAIGAALNVRDEMTDTLSGFIGITAASKVEFTSRNNDATRCGFCVNRCPRTFIDIQMSKDKTVRHISGYQCEKGSVDTLFEMKSKEKQKAAIRDRFPNLVHRAGIDVFAEYDFEPIRPGQTDPRAASARQSMTIGMPKLLNMFFYGPFFSTYFRCLGVGAVVWSDDTSPKLWNEGNKWGAIDPCFPAKVAPAHIYNLLQKKGLTHICFPIITYLQSELTDTQGENACVIQMGTPEVVDAAFTKSRNHFRDAGIEYMKPLVRMDRPDQASDSLFDYFENRLSITREEHDHAMKQAFAAVDTYRRNLREQGKQVINYLIDNDKMGILFIGHPYHHDLGLNHGILDEFQTRGFPILCIESIPTDASFLGPLFSDTESLSPFSISDVWARNFNRNTNLKVWAAKVASRHPNLAIIDMSSFKCGHDAPTYSYIDNITDASKTPHFLFHDVDQNKPSATINIRIQSIEYFLRLEEKHLAEVTGA